MRRQKGSILKGILIYFVVAFIALYGVVAVTKKFMSPVEGTMRSFFNTIKQNDYDVAYLLFTKRLKQRTPSVAFHKVIKDYKLYKYKDSSWHSERVKGKRAQIYGTIELTSGFLIDVEAELVLEMGQNTPIFGDVVDLSDIPLMQEVEMWRIDSLIFLQQPPSTKEQ